MEWHLFFIGVVFIAGPGLCQIPEPKCYAVDKTYLVEIPGIAYGNKTGFRNAVAQTECRKYCHSRKNALYYGLKRNGGGSKTKCYCADTLPGATTTGCSYRCSDNEACGGDKKISVYQVCPTNCKESNNYCDITGSICTGCINGYHGDSCDQFCPDNCVRCQQSDGVCDTCDDGYYGEFCDRSCPQNCASDRCQQSSGVCDGCEDGYYGDSCTNICPANCIKNRCDKMSLNGTCTNGCVPGYYGDLCFKWCPANCKDGLCDHVSGDCMQCAGDFHGSKCNITCPSNCDGQCDESTGNCPACQGGWYGARCDKQCPSNCLNHVCDKNDESCTYGCLDGWYGNLCNRLCPPTCKEKCERESGDCTNGCVDGFYGTRCNMNCSTNCVSLTCNQSNGFCTQGCVDKWYGDSCQEPCPTNCDEKCDRNSGDCTNGCDNGFYGVMCNMTCSTNCVSLTCNQSNGACSAGCVDMWHGDSCMKPCPTKCNEKCDRNSGECISGCDDGYYGDRCDMNCPIQCESSSCKQENGSCSHGCTSGYFGSHCQQICPSQCVDSLCDFAEGTCTNGCTEWIAGPKCETLSCPINCLNADCDGSDGHCLQGCVDGYHGDRCDDICPADCKELSCTSGGLCEGECKPGWYGPRCSDACSTNCVILSCDKETGACTDGCQEGWTGRVCAAPSALKGGALPTEGTAGISVAAVVIVGVVIAVSVIFVLRKKRKDNSRNAAIPFTELETSSNKSLALEDQGTVAAAVVTPPAQPVIYQNFSGSGTTVNIKEFPQYVKQKKSNDQILPDEYKNLPQGHLHPIEQAMRPEVKLKNRYKDLFPYDHNRVVLDIVGGDTSTDYVNASWIQGYRAEDKFIAAAGPTLSTIGDFWRMIWQENVSVVVMVTNLKELTKVKCEQYWPTECNAGIEIDDFWVVMTTENTKPDYITRNLTVRKGDEHHEVVHLHFTVWPDHGVPPGATALLNFRRKVLQKAVPNTPILVHCSAGVGRSGTFIALDYLIKQAAEEGKVGLSQCVSSFRHQRKSIIQTKDQYVFLHDALSEYLLLGDTTIQQHTYQHQIESLMAPGTDGTSRAKQQYQVLAELTPIIKHSDEDYALNPENKHKNRDPSIIPRLTSRVFLKSQVPGRNDYINAVTINSYTRRDGFLVTEIPQEGTTVDFWRMVSEYQCDTIIMFLTAAQKKEVEYFLPATNTALDVYENIASVTSSTSEPGYRTVDIFLKSQGTDTTPTPVLTNSSEENIYANVSDHATLPHTGTQQLRVFEVMVQADEESLQPQLAMEVYKESQAWRQHAGENPIVVTCWNGAQYSGQYVACSNLFEMIQCDQEADVFQVVRYIRDRRSQFISSLSQYVKLYEAVTTYLSQFNTYANL